MPTLSSPTTGAVNQPIALTMSWGSVTGATSYTLEISTASTFGSTVLSQGGITTASHLVSGLANSTGFFWQVSATNVGGTSAWSSVWNFTTIIATPGVPVLSSPSTGITGQATSLTLSWGTVTGASSYTVQLSTVSTFATTVANQAGLTTASPTVSGLTAGVKYFWRVNALNTGGTSAWAGAWNFTVNNGGIIIGIETEPMVTDQALSKLEPTVALQGDNLMYSVFLPCAVGISVTDLRGRTTVLVNQLLGPGHYCLGLRNRLPAAGLYVLRFKAANVDRIMKIVLRNRW